jgi:hypothetical protein
MHTRIAALFALITLLCASVALAAPTKLSQQGRLLDGDGTPLSDGHGMTFSLHDAETDGNEVWREERVVQFEEGYYSIILGTVTPLDDLLFAGSTVWMQLAVDGVVLSPRQEVVSVPYALRSAVAESVEGGTVDADEVAIGGNTVIDSSGNWLGTPTDWSELTGVPADLSDGDADSDTLLGLPCADGFVAKYSSSLGAWDCAQDNDSLAALICLTGEIPVYDLVTGLWLCGADLDTDTQLTEAQVDAFVANNNYSTGAHTTDTDTQLTETQVDAFVANNNYSTGAHTTNTDLLAGTSCNPGQVLVYSSANPGWECGEDTDTNLTQTELQTMIEVMTLNLQASTTIGGSPALTTASTLDPNQLDSSAASSGQVLTYDNGNVDWASTGGNNCQLVETILGWPSQLRMQCGSASFLVKASSTISANALIDPNDVPPGSGQNHVCIVENTGRVLCWGENEHGQASPPAGTFSSVVTGRDWGCGIHTDGTVECWGDDNYDQVSTPPTGTFTQLAVGGTSNTCGLSTSGNIQCWGRSIYNIVSGEPSGTFTQIRSGTSFYCALDTAGQIQCWGENVFGATSPPSGGGFTDISVGGYFGCGLRNSVIECWGRDHDGQVSSVPSGSYTEISAAYGSVCALSSGGSLACWGDGGYGQTTPPTGTFAGGLVPRDGGHCVLDQAGLPHCWGQSAANTPTTGSFTALHANNSGMCGLLTSGEVLCWSRFNGPVDVP